MTKKPKADVEDVRVGAVPLASGPLWTVFATYECEADARYAGELLREQTLPRKVPRHDALGSEK